MPKVFRIMIPYLELWNPKSSEILKFFISLWLFIVFSQKFWKLKNLHKTLAISILYSTWNVFDYGLLLRCFIIYRNCPILPFYNQKYSKFQLLIFFQNFLIRLMDLHQFTSLSTVYKTKTQFFTPLLNIIILFKLY